MRRTMEMEQIQGLEHAQRGALAQKMDTLIQQRQNVARQLMELGYSTPDAPAKIADDVLSRAVGALPKEHRGSLNGVLSAFPNIGALMMEHADLLALTSDDRLQEFALRVFFYHARWYVF